MYAGQGSIAFTGLARVVMTCGKHPDPEEEPDLCLMSVTKMNVARKPKALGYYIEALPDTLNDQDRSQYQWREFVDYTSDEILNADHSKRNGEAVSDKKQEVIDFLKSTLGDGGVEGRAVRQQAETRSISIRLLNKVKGEMGIVTQTVKAGKRGRPKVLWELPDTLVED